jgi:signal transduction histidine kinase
LCFSQEQSKAHNNLFENARTALQQSKELEGISLPESRLLAEKALQQNKNTGNDSLTSEILLQLGKVISTQGEKKEALELFQQALALSKENSYHQGICRSILEIGYIQYGWGEYEQSLPLFQEALNIALGYKLKDEEARALNLLGKYYHTKGSFAQSVEYYKKAIAVSNELTNRDQQVNFYLNLGKTYISEGNIYHALSNYLKAYEVSEQIEDKLLKADVLNHLGSIYLLLKQPEKSLHYHTKALNYRKQVNDPQAMATSYNNIGETYLSINEFDSAYHNFTQAYQLCKLTNYRKGTIKALTNIGRVENKTAKLEAANRHLHEALLLSTTSGYDAGLVESLLSLGQNFILKKEYSTAIVFFEKGLSKMGEANRSEFKSEAFFGLYKCHRQLGDFEKALQFHEHYAEAERNALLAENNQQLAELRVSFDMERKENDNQLLRQENELKQLALKQRAWIIWSTVVALFFTILLCLLIYNRYVQKRKSHTELKKVVAELELANTEKDRMFSIIAHELRNPLYWFQNLTEMLSKNHSKMGQEKLHKSLAAIDESAKNAFHLMDNLLNWSRTQLNRITPKKGNYSMSKLIDDTLCMFTTIIHQKELEVKLQIPKDVVIYVDADLFMCVIRNLVSNAIKYTPEKGVIAIKATVDNSICTVEVSDTGTGFEVDQFSAITSKEYFTSTTGLMNEKGSGLGLKLCHEFVHLNGGKIWVKMEKREGTCFVFTVPAIKDIQN